MIDPKIGDRVTLTAHGRDEWSMIKHRLKEGTVVEIPTPRVTRYISVKWDNVPVLNSSDSSLPHTHNEIKKVTT